MQPDTITHELQALCVSHPQPAGSIVDQLWDALGHRTAEEADEVMMLRREFIYHVHPWQIDFRQDQKIATPTWIVDEQPVLTEAATDFAGIRCPLCNWRPSATDRWFCGNHGHPEYFYGGCGTMWNTFTTRGRCPGCAHQWRYTCCLRCHQWSLHESWYSAASE